MMEDFFLVTRNFGFEGNKVLDYRGGIVEPQDNVSLVTAEQAFNLHSICPQLTNVYRAVVCRALKRNDYAVVALDTRLSALKDGKYSNNFAIPESFAWAYYIAASKDRIYYREGQEKCASLNWATLLTTEKVSFLPTGCEACDNSDPRVFPDSNVEWEDDDMLFIPVMFKRLTDEKIRNLTGRVSEEIARIEHMLKNNF